MTKECNPRGTQSRWLAVSFRLGPAGAQNWKVFSLGAEMTFNGCRNEIENSCQAVSIYERHQSFRTARNSWIQTKQPYLFGEPRCRSLRSRHRGAAADPGPLVRSALLDVRAVRSSILERNVRRIGDVFAL